MQKFLQKLRGFILAFLGITALLLFLVLYVLVLMPSALIATAKYLFTFGTAITFVCIVQALVRYFWAVYH